MSNYFTHLHLHTEYSLLDGAIPLDKVIAFAQEHQLPAIGISDHGNIFGAVKFFQMAKKAGIKPVLGIEAYITEDATIKDTNNRYHHLLIMVENKVGYRNLCKLISYAYQEGFYFKPRIDYNALEKYHEGLIVGTACLGGHIPQLLLNGQEKEARERIDWYCSLFGRDHFYFELHPEEQEEQTILNKKLCELSKELNIDMITACDAHYPSLDDYEAHEVMLSIQTHAKLTDEDRFSFGEVRAYMKTPQEMLELFKDNQQAVYNTGKIADRCEFDFETGKLFFPRFDIPDNLSPEDYFKKLCKQGLDALIEQGRIPTEQKEAYQQRLDEEMDLIIKMGFDIDFCIERRERVIDYCREKYGHDKVCQIITFGTMMAKGVIKDVARTLGFSFEDSNMITSLIPDQLKITLKEALETEPRLRDLVDNNPKAKNLFDLSFRLEGLTRHASKHAAGIVISPEAIDEVLPVYVPPKTNELVTQYAMTELESLGFLKIDFLGLKNLTLIDRALKLIEKNHSVKINIDMLDLTDQKTFELLCAGNTSGVFQLESEGLKEVLRKLQPSVFEDIIAVNALYRPGPLGSGMVDDFIERRHGRQKITYLLPELEPILKETYGVIVYQEQVMKIASAVGGYSLGEADILRRAMGKKKVDVMAQQRELFLSRAQERGTDGKKAGELFDLMAYFAGYGFNKSHSAAYALIAYQTAYLKAHYPAEFMACLISLEATNSDKMSFYLQEAKDMGLKIFSPDINKSEIDFSAIDGDLLFGLQGIKSVGLAALENILEVRKKKPFIDLLDFCTRIDLRTANKRVIEHLIYAGAFDQLPGHRAQQFNELSSILDRALEKKRALETGQIGLFDMSTAKKKESDVDLYEFQSCTPWTDKELLEHEKEVVGFYLTAHPLEGYKQQLDRFNLTQIAQLPKDGAPGQEITATCCGLLKSRRDIFTKKGDRMSFLQIEDMSGTAEIIVFPRLFKKVESWLDDYTVFITKGGIDLTARAPKIKANELIPLELFFEQGPKIEKITLTLPDQFEETLLESVKQLVGKGQTALEFVYQENGKKLTLKTKMNISVNSEIITALESSNIGINLFM